MITTQERTIYMRRTLNKSYKLNDACGFVSTCYTITLLKLLVFTARIIKVGKIEGSTLN